MTFQQNSRQQNSHQKTNHIVTGATGFMGGHLITQLLASPTTHIVYALARDSKRATAKERVLAALRVSNYAGTELPDNLVVVEAEITQPHCGVADADIELLADKTAPTVFWHLAASLRWEEGRRESVFNTNLNGTRHAMTLAKIAHADMFIYVSTAYTCGISTGIVPEEFHAGGKFNNVYEESKHAAESYVRDNTDASMKTLVLRPSIIVGTSITYKPSGSYTGLYGFLTELRRFKKMMADSTEVVRYSAEGRAVLSFIPIDHVVSDALHVAMNELNHSTRPVYHLTADSGPALIDLLSYCFEKVGLENTIQVVDGEIQDPTPLERLFARRMEFFSGYTCATKNFQRTLTTPRALEMSDMMRFINGELTAEAAVA